MKLIHSVRNPVLILCMVIFANTSLLAQLSLSGTRWNGNVNLSFNGDTLTLLDKVSKAILWGYTYGENKDTLILLSAPNNTGCNANQARYKVSYRHSGQLLYLTAIQDGCVERKEMLGSEQPFDFIPYDGVGFRDWMQRDAMTDAIAGISLYRANDLLKGRKSREVLVAVIDNGFDIQHEDLKNIFWTNPGEIPGNGTDDDHNGYIDDVHGWNFRTSKNGTLAKNELAAATQYYLAWKDKYDHADEAALSNTEKAQWRIYQKAKAEYEQQIRESNDSFDLNYGYNILYNSSTIIGDDPKNPRQTSYGSPLEQVTPEITHGTHVSGTIAAIQDNGIGTDGIAGNVRILPVVASAGGGDERDKDVANGIRYAVDNGARIINISFTKPYSSYKIVVDEAIQYAEKKQVLIIVCAGNYRSNLDSVDYYPVALYDNGKVASNLIKVGWSRSLFNYRLAHPNSDYSRTKVDVFAPGSDIFSTIPGNGYDFKSGSSMSAPVVTGIAALLLSYFPSLSIAQVREIIVRSAFKPTTHVNRPGTTILVPFSSLSVSGGIVNAYHAIKMAIAISKHHKQYRHHSKN